jgi:putative peptidoglycan lipid II flippase
VIVQLSGLAVSTALFPRLAEMVSGGDLKTAGQELTGALMLVFKMALPACAGLILLRTQIVQILFEHGAFDAQATSLVSAPILWYSIAALADSLCQPLWRVVYVKHSGWSVVAINGVQTTIRLIGNILLTPWLGYVGLAVSAAIGLSLQVVALTWWTSGTYGFKFTKYNWREITQTIIAAFLAITISFLIYTAAEPAPSIVKILVCSLSGALVYILSLYLANNFRRVFYGS